MKRILFFNDTLQYGGTEIMLINILKYISDKNYKLTLLLPYPNPKDTLLKDIPNNISIEYIYTKRPNRWRKILLENLMSFFPSIHNKLTGLDLNKYDLIISFKDSIYSILFSRSKIRNILWIHNLPTKNTYGINNLKEYIPVKLLQKRINRLINSYKKFSEVICVSHICKQKYIEVYNNGKLPSQKIYVLHNAIDKEKISKLSDQLIDIEDLSVTTFIMATRFSVEKRVDRVITAAAQLKEKGYKFNILILGDGEFRNQIETLISKHSLGDVVSILGYVENPYPYIKKSDWLISSSEKESFSLVLLESIFLGTPVITTDCGGPTEITENGKYGLLTPNSTEGIYWGMEQVLKSPEIADNYTTKAQECLIRFDYNKWLQSVLQIIDKN